VKLIDALIKSNCWMATRHNDRGYRRDITACYLSSDAPFNVAKIRLVAGATDRTVQGKLSARQLDAADWQPVNIAPYLLNREVF
jgi:hypothetical protein